jgi:hypothetical protein
MMKMNIFQHAAYWPFEVVLIDKAIELKAPDYVLIVILLLGLVYARYVGGYFAGIYSSFPPNLRVARMRIPFVAALVFIPIGAEKIIEGLFQIGKHFVH